jgi:signal transduction histidine kinase
MHVATDDEVLRLREGLRDLVALSAMPAVWIGSEPPAVASGLADALVGLLGLDFAFVRLSDPAGAAAVDVMRGSASPSFRDWLDSRLATGARLASKEVVPSGLAVPVGIGGEGGLIAVASQRSDFPTPMDELLLTLAANHAAVAFQTASLIHERTAELHVANDELSALRRVATLVAEGVQPQDLFAVVAEEVGRVVEVPLVSVIRYEPDRTATECASFSTEGPLFPVGKRWALEGTNVLRLVRETCEPARIDDHSRLQGEIADAVRRSGIRSTVGVPVVVGGRVWGAMVVSTTEHDPLPIGTEARLAEFTELLATAVENAGSREALKRVGEEQAALRRVATLVARGVEPVEIFSAVSEEVGRLFGSDLAAVARFEHDPPANVVVGVAGSIEGFALGSRWQLDDAMASAQVYRTGRSARVDAVDWSAVSAPIAAAASRLGTVSTVSSPIIVEGRLWGTINVSAKEPLPLDAEERQEKFTELLATAIANAEGKSELTASRMRIVTASDEARRRIERDLHDGTQQRLISLAMALRGAEADVPPVNGDLRAELSRIATGLTDTVADLQEISRGIHPAILSKGGLGPALRTLARRSTIPVEVDVTTNARLPEPIEVAAYYVASEALANATKHAQASRIELSLATRSGSLLLSIRDDGVGGADPARGSGLLGLADRVQALGGSVRVSSRPGEGTHITAELPVELEVRGNS